MFNKYKQYSSTLQARAFSNYLNQIGQLKFNSVKSVCWYENVHKETNAEGQLSV